MFCCKFPFSPQALLLGSFLCFGSFSRSFQSHLSLQKEATFRFVLYDVVSAPISLISNLYSSLASTEVTFDLLLIFWDFCWVIYWEYLLLVCLWACVLYTCVYTHVCHCIYLLMSVWRLDVGVR